MYKKRFLRFWLHLLENYIVRCIGMSAKLIWNGVIATFHSLKKKMNFSIKDFFRNLTKFVMRKNFLMENFIFWSSGTFYHSFTLQTRRKKVFKPATKLVSPINNYIIKIISVYPFSLWDCSRLAVFFNITNQ